MKLYIEDNEAIPSIKVLPDGDAAPVGFSETTDIVLVDRYGLKAVDPLTEGWRDRKAVKDTLKTLIYTKMQVAVPADTENQAKWDLLTVEEKSIAVHWFLIGKESFQLEVVNDDKYWTQQAEYYREWTKDAKFKRLCKMEATVFRRCLNLGDAKDLLQEVNQVMKDTNIVITAGILTDKFLVKTLHKSYVEGIDGTVEDNADGHVFVGLLDWIDSRVATPFEGNGLRNTAYPFKGAHTANSVADELLTIANGSW